MSLQEQKGTVDGYEWRCRSQSKDNPHDVVRSIGVVSPRERWMGAEAGRHDRHNRSKSSLHVFLDSGGKNEFQIFSTPEEDEILDFVRNHDVLYNTRHPDYRKAQTKQLWESIGTTLEKSGT
ncbi:hypothetical protein TNCV_189151 [Trichonephila clavipes]|nr:hypothetical protein TNCV_189151 [Trichonephila clavipes]